MLLFSVWCPGALFPGMFGVQVIRDDGAGQAVEVARWRATSVGSACALMPAGSELLYKRDVGSPAPLGWMETWGPPAALVVPIVGQSTT